MLALREKGQQDADLQGSQGKLAEPTQNAAGAPSNDGAPAWQSIQTAEGTTPVERREALGVAREPGLRTPADPRARRCGRPC